MAAPRSRERLVFHVQELERVQALQREASACVKDSFDAALRDGYDPGTLKVVLKLRRMTPDQRRERRALESIYLAARGMLEGDPLTDEARRRLDPAASTPAAESSSMSGADQGAAPAASSAPSPAMETTEPAPTQAPLVLKTPDEARAEGAAAADAGARIYDNPYPAGDPCRAAWDEGWCTQSNAHGMETPAAYQRRTAKPSAAPPADAPAGEGDATKKETPDGPH